MSDTQQRFDYTVGQMEKFLLPYCEQSLPLLIFANKIDKKGMDTDEVFKRMQKSALGHPMHIV